MSILIKGLKLPDECDLLVIITPGGTIEYTKNTEQRWSTKRNSAVEVKTPHGRLIDADAVKNIYKEELTTKYKDGFTQGFQLALRAVLGENTTTIIEAEDG